MKKRTIWTKLGDFLEGRGFYIVLALCIVAIGGSGYYLYRMISLSDQLANQSVSAQASVPSGAAQEKTDTEQAVEDAVKAAADRAAAAKAKAEEKTKTAAAKTQEKDPTKSAQGDQDLTAKPSQDEPDQARRRHPCRQLELAGDRQGAGHLLHQQALLQPCVGGLACPHGHGHQRPGGGHRGVRL